jgi:uncharacterized phage infection (PIP) family protein YhgE
MKKTILIASAMVFTMACNQKEIEKSNSQRDSLATVLKERENLLAERENTMNEFISSFNEVERNLDCVAVRQHIIASTADRGGDIKGNQKERINSHINAINNLMEENRKTIADLRKRIKSSSRKNKKLEETVATLTEQLNQKTAELAALNDKLAQLNTQLAQLQTNLDTMTMKSNRQAETINQHLTTIHTAYYIVGRTKDLKEAKIIDRKGGMLGVGKTDRLSQGFDQSKFTRIDYTTTSVIPVNSNHVKIITNHPTDSYKLEVEEKNNKIVKNLVITNPERFWSVSKFLVVEGNPVNADNTMSGQAAVSRNKM